MNRLRRSLWRFELLVLVVALQGVLLGGSNVAPSQGAPVPEATFASVGEPIGGAASPFQLLWTHPFCEGDGFTREVVLINSDGSVTPFATLPSRGEGCGEDHIAIATPFPNTPESTATFPTPNPAGFTSGDKFVTQGGNVYRIRWNATIPHTVLTSLIPAGDLFASIETDCQLSTPTFDTAGTFGGGTVGKLIVVISPCGEEDGSVAVLNSDGTTANTIDLPNGTVGTEVEGAAVAPSSFGNLAGQLLIAAEKATADSPGAVFAVSSTGTITRVATIPFAEDVKIVPTTRCTYGQTNGATYFTAIFNPASTTEAGTNIVDQLPLSAFTGEGGNALVPSAKSTGGANPPGITRLTPGLATSTFRAFFLPHQGSTFTDCSIPVLVQTQLNTPGGGGRFVPRSVPPLLAWIPGRSVNGDARLISPLLAQAIRADNENTNKYFSVTWFPDPNFNPTLIRTRTVRLFINGKVLRPAFCRGTREDDDNQRHPPQPVTCFFRLEDVSNPHPPYKIVAIYRDSGGGGDPECEGGGG